MPTPERTKRDVHSGNTTTSSRACICWTHQLRRAVAYANFGKLRFKSEHEQQIWGECSRLITNCIVFYNATLLSHLLEHTETTGDGEAAALLKQVSPVAWQHINFYGRYEFGKQPEAIDLEEIIQQLVRIRFESDLIPTA